MGQDRGSRPVRLLPLATSARCYQLSANIYQPNSPVPALATSQLPAVSTASPQSPIGTPPTINSKVSSGSQLSTISFRIGYWLFDYRLFWSLRTSLGKFHIPHSAFRISGGAPAGSFIVSAYSQKRPDRPVCN